MSLGVLFVNMRSPRSQQFLNDLEAIGMTLQFRVIDVSKEPHKFTEPIRRRCRGRLPLLIVRGMNNYLVDEQAFHWLNIEKNKRSRAPPGSIGTGAGPSTGPEGFSFPPGPQAAAAQGQAASSSLDAMYAPLINPNNVQLPNQQGGGSGKVSNGEFEAYMQSRNQGIPGQQRRM